MFSLCVQMCEICIYILESSINLCNIILPQEYINLKKKKNMAFPIRSSGSGHRNEQLCMRSCHERLWDAGAFRKMIRSSNMAGRSQPHGFIICLFTIFEGMIFHSFVCLPSFERKYFYSSSNMINKQQTIENHHTWWVNHKRTIFYSYVQLPEGR